MSQKTELKAEALKLKNALSGRRYPTEVVGYANKGDPIVRSPPGYEDLTIILSQYRERPDVGQQMTVQINKIEISMERKDRRSLFALGHEVYHK